MNDNAEIKDESNGYNEAKKPVCNALSANVSTVFITGVNQIDSLISGVKWANNNVTFSFPTSRSDYTGYTVGEEPSSHFVALDTTQQDAARSALAKWASVSNLNFIETTGGNGEIRFGTSSKPDTSWAYLPNSADWGGDVWFGNSTDSSPTNPIVGNYAFATYVHELGHALGLKHPHGTSGVTANRDNDTIEYSIMSYKSYVGAPMTGYTIPAGSFPTGPMMSDIAAIQEMYGANYNYNSGNNVYTFDPNQTKIFQTIWDGGGNDTYDLSAYTTNLSIDLRAGAWSTFDSNQLANLGNGNHARGNVANALLHNGDTRSLIDNATGGSGNDTLIGNQVNNLLNGGLGADLMQGGAGNDSYVVDNVGDVVMENLAEGTDGVYSTVSYTIGSNIENLILFGNANINGTGNGGSNVIYGNIGNNVIDGGVGADYMAGGVGNDIYMVDNVGDGVVENLGEGTDGVYSTVSYTIGSNIENLILYGNANVNGTGNSGNNVMSGNSGNNVIDGGAGADNMSGGAGNDIYMVDNVGDIVVENVDEGVDGVYSTVSYTIGSNIENLILYGNDNVNGTGNSGNNVMYGNSGNNLIDGGAGIDYMAGGAGNDSYIVDNIGDSVVENVSEGTDGVYSTISYTIGSNIENLILSGNANVNGTGNSGSNVMYGNIGNNVIDGGVGADYMAGGAGNDIYMVDNVGDAVVENLGEGTDGVYSTVSYTIGSNIENLILYGNTNVNGTGNSGNNIMYGNSGNNVIDGGAGADNMSGGAGNDIYMVDNVGDIVVENVNEGVDGVYSTVSYTIGSNTENLILYGNDSVNGTGNSGNNVMYGNSANNVINGGVGIDYMAGGAGNDSYVVDNIGDTVVENASEGTDGVYSTISYTIGSNIENLILSGNANINGTGNSGSNVMYGNIGNNVIDGGAGADYMAGGVGNDIYMVDNVGDAVVENLGEGTDGVYSTVSYTISSNIENLILYGNANVNATGNSINNVMYGNSGNNVIDGGAGADNMSGGLGNDIYIVDNISDSVMENANEGIDGVYSTVGYTIGSNIENLILFGNANINGTGNGLDNIIVANTGNDNLYGGAGNDILYGGVGNNLLDGGLGNDTYIFGVDSGNQTINSFVGNTNDNGVDTISFQNMLLSNIGFTKAGNDLICTISQTGKTIDVSSWFLGTSYQVDTLQFADGVLTATQVSQKIA